MNGKMHLESWDNDDSSWLLQVNQGTTSLSTHQFYKNWVKPVIGTKGQYKLLDFGGKALFHPASFTTRHVKTVGVRLEEMVVGILLAVLNSNSNRQLSHKICSNEHQI